jgi:membrane associated rhomboid family serine protease
LLTGFVGAFRVQGMPVGPIITYLFALYPLGSDFHVWQLVTYMFMHGSLMHLLFNMFALWMFGMQLENDWGSRKFLIFYTVCGIGAGISNLFLAPFFGAAGPTVGASGAIYGVLLAFGMTYPDQNIMIFPIFFPIRARFVVLFYILIEVLSVGSSDGIAHLAHLGGAAVAFVYLVAEQRRLPGREIWQRARERFTAPQYANRYASRGGDDISDANYRDVHDNEDRVSQQQIDEILDKISQRGYQSLSDEEKKILFEASKKLN